MNFETFNLHPSIMAGVRDTGLHNPTPIQLESIPRYYGRAVILLAWPKPVPVKPPPLCCPILHRLMRLSPGSSQCPESPPTRELAEQTCETINL